jgi:hypothetical protein
MPSASRSECMSATPIGPQTPSASRSEFVSATPVEPSTPAFSNAGVINRVAAGILGVGAIVGLASCYFFHCRKSGMKSEKLLPGKGDEADMEDSFGITGRPSKQSTAHLIVHNRVSVS